VHTGIDIDAPLNTPIIAAASGTVTWAGFGLLKKDGDMEDPYGQAVVIRHDFGYHGLQLSTVYAHMSRVDVQVGQVVAQSERIGMVGMTGFTTGPHVHFEVRLESKTSFTTRNPELWLTPPEGDGLIVGRFLNDYGGYIGSTKVTVSTPSGDKIDAYTYGPHSVNADDYYKENFVVGDLPAGIYTIKFIYLRQTYSYQIKIFPGVISFSLSMGKQDFHPNSLLRIPKPG